jgi:hypothetical protein
MQGQTDVFALISLETFKVFKGVDVFALISLETFKVFKGVNVKSITYE